MSPEAEQPAAPSQGQAGATPGEAGTAVPATAANTVSRRPAGVPVWRTGKPDAFLAAAVETARTALEGITAASHIGRHLSAKSEGDRLVTHLFESNLPGYVGWQWYAVVTRNSRSKVVTVSELGLLPSEDSILSPEWVPWAERVRPEDAQEQEDDNAERDNALPETGKPAPDGETAVSGPIGEDPETGFDAADSDAADNDFTEAAPGDADPLEQSAGDDAGTH